MQVRQALAQGRLDLVEQWLDRPYTVVAQLPAAADVPAGYQRMQCVQCVRCATPLRTTCAACCQCAQLVQAFRLLVTVQSVMHCPDN